MKNILKTTQCLSLEEIRKYLSKELSEEQRFEVENHMLDCPLCNDAVDGFASNYSFDDDHQLDEIQAAIEKHGEPAAPVNIRPVRSLLFNRIAASLLFLIVAGAAYLYWQSDANQRIYQAYYETPDTDLFAGLRSGENTNAIPASLDTAIKLYSEKKFSESLPFFESYLAGSPDNPTANYLAAMAYLETNRMEAAKEQLAIARINGDQYYEQASWYLALANIKTKNIPEAVQLLEELEEVKGNRYRAKARELLDQLK